MHETFNFGKMEHYHPRGQIIHIKITLTNNNNIKELKTLQKKITELETELKEVKSNQSWIIKLNDIKEQIDTYFNKISDEDFLRIANEYKLIITMNYYLISINRGKKIEELLVQASSSYKAVQFVLEHKGNDIESVRKVYRNAEVLSRKGPLYAYGVKHEGCLSRYVISNDLATVSAHYPEAIEIWKDHPHEIINSD